MLDYVFLKLINCMQCPYCGNDRTQGAGFAIDYFCKLTPDSTADYKFKVIKGYVEWKSEGPQDNEIPDWCPLFPLLRS